MNADQSVFRPDILAAFSPAVQKNMEMFSKAITSAEGVLRGYHNHTDATFTGSYKGPFDSYHENARLIFTLSWSKAILFSRSIVESVNNKNLLSAFQAIRGYVELVSTLRYTFKKMAPLIQKAIKDGKLTLDDARILSAHMDLLIHGGRFNWKAYFDEGVSAFIDRKKVKMSKEERAKFESNSLRIGACIKDWGQDSPAAEFIYDYLCELVHPNKGSNMVVLVKRDDLLVFDINEMSPMGIELFERIFPYAVSMCMEEMARTPFFAELGGEEAQNTLRH